jgi:putative peptidoglycan lipid II flippase
VNEPSNQTNRQVARAAGTVMLAFIISQLTGLAAKILIAGSFSAGVELDAFYAANRPSETLVTIMAGGILVSSFIPIFVKFLVKEDRRSAWELASATANLILVLMSLLAGLAALFAGPIVHYILGAGFSPDKQALTISLLRIQSISVVFFGLSGLAVGVLNSHHKFLVPALAPAMYQLGQIFGVLVLAPGMGIYGLAWGVVLGSVFNLLIQVPSLLRLKGRYSPTLGLHDPSIREVFRLMVPRMFGAAVVQLMLWINTLLASHMEGGSVFSLTYGFSLMIVAQVSIAQSVATAVMPTFSAQYAQGHLDELRRTLASALRGVILLSAPATAGLILLSGPIVTFLYQRREFTPETTSMVAWALTWYAAGLVFHSSLEVLVRAYYAMHDTKTPVLVGAAAMLLSIGLSLIFAPLFRQVGWMPHGGLALAVSVSTALEVTILFLIMRKRLKGIHGLDIARGSGVAALGTLGMTAALVVWMQAVGSSRAALTTLGGVAIGGLVYGLLLILLRVPEVGSVIRMVRRRVSRPH